MSYGTGQDMDLDELEASASEAAQTITETATQAATEAQRDVSAAAKTTPLPVLAMVGGAMAGALLVENRWVGAALGAVAGYALGKATQEK